MHRVAIIWHVIPDNSPALAHRRECIRFLGILASHIVPLSSFHLVHPGNAYICSLRRIRCIATIGRPEVCKSVAKLTVS